MNSKVKDLVFMAMYAALFAVLDFCQTLQNSRCGVGTAGSVVFSYILYSWSCVSFESSGRNCCSQSGNRYRKKMAMSDHVAGLQSGHAKGDSETRHNGRSVRRRGTCSG